MSKAISWAISKTRAEKRIEGPDGNYILLQKMTQGDKDDLMDLLATMEIKDKTKDQLANMNLGKMKHFQRVRSIKEWNLKYEDGTPIAVSAEAIRNLPDFIIEEIDAAIDELNPEKSAEAKKK